MMMPPPKPPRPLRGKDIDVALNSDEGREALSQAMVGRSYKPEPEPEFAEPEPEFMAYEERPFVSRAMFYLCVAAGLLVAWAILW